MWSKNLSLIIINWKQNCVSSRGHNDRRLPRRFFFFKPDSVNQNTTKHSREIKKKQNISRHIQNKRQLSDIQHSTRHHNHQIQHRPIHGHTFTDKTGEEASKKRWAGLAPPPVQVALPFLWATVLLNFARNWRSQCAKTCDCHSAPWPMGGMNGTVTTRLVGGATGAWGCTFFFFCLSTQVKRVCWGSHTHTKMNTSHVYDHLHVLVTDEDLKQ